MTRVERLLLEKNKDIERSIRCRFPKVGDTPAAIYWCPASALSNHVFPGVHCGSILARQSSCPSIIGEILWSKERTCRDG
jgi:hypothetical protein